MSVIRRRPLLAALFLFVGIVLSPLRAVATTFPLVFAYDAGTRPTATVRVEARPSLRSSVTRSRAAS